MKPTPPGWPRLSIAVFYEDPKPAIDWLVRAFDFDVRLKVEGDDGALHHSELTYGDAVVMVAQAGRREGAERDMSHQKSPKQVGGGNTQSVMLYVDDVEAHCRRAREAGGKVTYEPKTSDYGDDYWSDRSYECQDPEGHRWWFCQRLRTGKGA